MKNINMSITVTFVCDATEHKYAFPYEGLHKFGSFSMEGTNAKNTNITMQIEKNSLPTIKQIQTMINLKLCVGDDWDTYKHIVKDIVPPLDIGVFTFINYFGLLNIPYVIIK